jgi:hypothetical protein
MTSLALLPLRRAARLAVAALVVTTLSGLYPAFAQEEPAAAPADDAATQASEPAATDATAPADGSAEATTAAPAEASAEAPLETVPVDGAEAEVAAESHRPYTFAATRFRHTEFDESADDGFGIEGSWLLQPNMYAVGAIFASESDDARSTETTQFELGGGYLLPLSNVMDFNAAIRVVQRDINSEPQSQVKMGFQVDGGVRYDLSPRIEGSAAVRYAETSRNARVFLTGAALYQLAAKLSVGAEAIIGSNSASYGLVGRWAF